MSRGVAIVTGAGRGIGEAIALNLAEEDFSLGLIGRDQEELSEVAKACRALGVRVEFYPIDLRKIEEIPNLISKIAEDLGGINVLVNNAGVWIEKDIRKATLQDWDTSIDVNLSAVFALTKYALPYLENSHGAAIINISSTAAHRTYSEGTMYTASKHGLAGLTGSLFYDLREQGIKVSAISPGHVNTSLHADDPTLDPDKMIQPEDVAQAVRFVLNFPKNSCPTEITIMPQYSPKLTQKEG